MSEQELQALRAMSVDEITRENAARAQRLQVDYDPLRGVGCCGDRVEVGNERVPRALVEENPRYARLSRPERERVRIRYDFEYWCARCVKVRDKLTARTIPLVLNAPQRRVAAMLERERTARRPMRMIMLKARQWGGSTLTQMYMAWMQIVHHRHWNSVICGHVHNTARAIKGMYRRLIKHYPKALLDTDAPPLELRNYEGSTGVQQLTGRDCLIIQGSAMSEDAVRGYDVAMAHLTEVAFWKDSTLHSPTDVIRAVSGSVAMEPDTLVVLESTANGMGTFFHTEWLRASAGLSDKMAVFVPWHEIEIYRKPVTDVAALWNALDDYELALWAQGLTLEMINWYHHKRREYNSPAQMKAEFPTTDVEAFVSTGYGVFAAEHLATLRRGCRRAAVVGDIVAAGDERAKARIDVRGDGPLQVWAQPRQDTRYVVAVDVGGRSDKADYSVIVVLDAHTGEDTAVPEVVAQWRGHIDHDRLARKAVLMARYYSDALLVIESNTLEHDTGEGAYVLHEVSRLYPRLYFRESEKPGFHTNVNTKAQALGRLIEAVREGGYVERAHEAIDEMAVYEQKPNDSMGARRGAHDDMVMARAIGLHVLLERNLHRPATITDGDKRVMMRGWW